MSMELENLLRSGKSAEAAALAFETANSASPGEQLFLRYDAAFALLQENRHPEALSTLASLLGEACRADITFRAEELRFAYACSIQLAMLSEFCHHYACLRGEDKQLLASLSFFGASCAKLLAFRLGEKSLADNAESMCGNFWPKKTGFPVSEDNLFLRLDSPICLQIEPTNNCNLACTMCPRSRMTRKRGYLSMDTLSACLSSWRNARRVFNLPHLLYNELSYRLGYRGGVKLFFMGEPLLHPQLDELISAVRESGAKVGIQTNGVLLSSPEVRKRIVNSRPDDIGVSIDGISAETYEKIRGHGQLEKCFAGVSALHQELCAAGLQKEVPISVSTILAEINDETRKKVLSFLKPIGHCLADVSFLPLNTKHQPGFIDGNGELKIYDNSGLGAPISQRPAPLCEEPLKKLNILWDGTVVPCCLDENAQMPLGNAKDGIDKLWQGESVRAIHRALLYGDLSSHPHCAKCLQG